MYNRTEQASMALNAFRKTGAPLPTEVQAALDTGQRIRSFVAENLTGNHLAAALLTALQAGDDPHESPEVAAATQRAVWSQPTVASTLDAAPATAIMRAVVDNADALITAMIPAYTAAVQDLTAAHKVLGDVDLRDDHEKILALGSKAATAWAKAISAVEITNDVTHAWQAIAGAARWWEGLFPAATVEWDANRWVELHHATRPRAVGADAWESIRHGWHLRLADSATLRDFEADVARAQERAAEAAAKQRDNHPMFRR